MYKIDITSNAVISNKSINLGSTFLILSPKKRIRFYHILIFVFNDFYFVIEFKNSNNTSSHAFLSSK